MVYVVLVFLGLAFGSFVNALVWRIHEIKAGKKLTTKHRRELSILHGRSMCSHCHHRLAWNDLVPVISWLSLRGKCRYCRKPIGDSPLVEAGLAAAFVLSYAFWPVEVKGQGLFDFIVWLVVLVALAALLVYDLKWMLLPNKIVHPLFWVVIGSVIVNVVLFGGGWRVSLDSLYGFLVGGGIFYLLFQLSGGKWIGGGDVRLGAILGLIVASPTKALLVIFVASSLGTLYALPLLLTRRLKTNTRVPFGPFLIAGAVLTKLFGSAFLAWYSRQFLII